jgi:hypothetical protein
LVDKDSRLAITISLTELDPTALAADLVSVTLSAVITAGCIANRMSVRNPDGLLTVIIGQQTTSLKSLLRVLTG